MKVNFYNTIEDELLKFAVIISKHNGLWVYCKHKNRHTWEIPGGHREANEDILDTAKRELWEETGAIDYDISPVCVYSVERNGTETYGMLYYAEVFDFETLPNLEIEKIDFFKEIPENLTYPIIQTKLIKRISISK